MEQLKHEEQIRKIFQNVNDWLKFADAKNLALLTIESAVIFGLTKVITDGRSCWSSIFLNLSMGIILISFLTTLISSIPILNKITREQYIRGWINKFSNWIDDETPFENIHYYGYLR